MSTSFSRLGPILLGVVAIAGVACSKKGGADADQSVPVVVATARQGGFVVYRSQPGTVTPSNSVLVRSQVDGVLKSIAFSGGQMVKQGDVLAEIETDKANMEMEAQGSGILRKILVEAGGKAPIGTLIGVIAEANEDIEPLIAKEGAKAGAAAKAAAAPAPAAPAPAAPAPEPAQAAAEASAKAAPADQPASAAAAEKTPPAPPAPAARPAPAPAPVAASASTGGEGGRVKASPLARSMAAHQNIDLSSVAGSGPGGRIIKRDIESWAGPRPSAAPARVSAAPSPRPAPPGP